MNEPTDLFHAFVDEGGTCGRCGYPAVDQRHRGVPDATAPPAEAEGASRPSRSRSADDPTDPWGDTVTVHGYGDVSNFDLEDSLSAHDARRLLALAAIRET